METQFTFRHMESTEGLKEHTKQKMEKIKNYLLKPISANVIFSLDKFRQKCEITVMDSGIKYVGHETTPDMYLSVDRAVDKIVNQLKKKKERVKNHKAGHSSVRGEPVEP